jgi:hypothetical protein
MSKVTIFLIILLVGLVAIIYWQYQELNHSETVESFEECLARGYTIMESYPRQCVTPDGEIFIEELPDKEGACIQSGGTVSTALCCKSVGDFPNLCVIGPCGCSPDNSHEVKICDCGSDRCFNGQECVDMSFGNGLPLGEDALNSTYLIEGEEVTLTDGYAEKEIAPGSASKITVQAVQDVVKGDADEDGLEEAFLFLSYNAGGTGTFYYLAAALNLGEGYQGTNTLFLGDRITPESISLRDNVIVVNYLERAEGESMVEEPSLEKMRRVILKDGRLEEIAGNDLIEVYSPIMGERISSPLIITGQARGNWYFEADFPIVLVDWDGLIIAEAIAQAQGDWMTEDFVPFRAEIEFEKPDYGERGTLILRKDNPSGLPENDDAIEIPVFF